MHLKSVHIVFRLIISLLVFFLLTSIGGFAQKVNTQGTSSKIVRKLIPDYMKLQFAGGIGFISSGIGYTFFNNRLDMSFFYSYLPSKITVNDLHSISFQLTAKPIKLSFKNDIIIYPLDIGVFTHHTFGSEFWVKLPNKYSKGYYWWYPGINAGFFLGAEIKTRFLACVTPASGTAVYIRIGTRGLYVASKVGNTSIPFIDILEFGFGVALYR